MFFHLRHVVCQGGQRDWSFVLWGGQLASKMLSNLKHVPGPSISVVWEPISTRQPQCFHWGPELGKKSLLINLFPPGDLCQFFILKLIDWLPIENTRGVRRQKNSWPNQTDTNVFYLVILLFYCIQKNKIDCQVQYLLLFVRVWNFRISSYLLFSVSLGG